MTHLFGAEIWAQADAIGARGAHALLRGGYDTAAKVRAASDADLLKIHALGTTTLTKIRAVFPADDQPTT